MANKIYNNGPLSTRVTKRFFFFSNFIWFPEFMREKNVPRMMCKHFTANIFYKMIIIAFWTHIFIRYGRIFVGDVSENALHTSTQRFCWLLISFSLLLPHLAANSYNIERINVMSFSIINCSHPALTCMLSLFVWIYYLEEKKRLPFSFVVCRLLMWIMLYKWIN